MNKELKPCPFCGGQAHIIYKSGYYEVKIECKECKCSTQPYDAYFDVRDSIAEQAMCGYIDDTCKAILDISIRRATNAWNKRYHSDDELIDEQITKL